jgi:hypothetical protein
VVDAQLVIACAQAAQLGADARLVADQQDFEAALAMRAQGTLGRRGRSQVAPHGVECDQLQASGFRHQASGQKPRRDFTP